MHFGKLLPPTLLPEVKRYFTVYLNIRSYHRRKPYATIDALLPDAAYFIKAMRVGRPLPDFLSIIRSAIIDEMKNLAQFFHVLSHYVEGFPAIPGLEFWNTASAEVLAEMFVIIKVADRNLGNIKAQQLARMADILERYENWLRPCVAKDESARKPAHIIVYLRSQASKVKEHPEQIIRSRWNARIIFAQRQFYLIPYNQVLRVFLKVLERYPATGISIPSLDPPPEVEPPLWSRWKQKPPGPVKPKPQPTQRPLHQYPPEMTVVMDRISSVYSRLHKEQNEDKKALPRVINTRYSIPGRKGTGGANQPSFFVCQEHPTPRNMKKWEYIYPLPEKEFEWLEAFLLVCTYMSKMQEVWSGGQTVADYWKTHVGPWKKTS